MQGLGYLPGETWSSAHDVSADGSVVVGTSDTPEGSQGEAFRWTESSGMVGIGDLPGGGSQSQAYGVSTDGSVVVGQGSAVSGYEAFRWTQSGGMVGLGDLPGGELDSWAFGVSADGSVVVGYSWSAWDLHEGFRWTASEEMIGLGGGKARAVSADGLVVVGDSVWISVYSTFKPSKRVWITSPLVSLPAIPISIDIAPPLEPA